MIVPLIIYSLLRAKLSGCYQNYTILISGAKPRNVIAQGMALCKFEIYDPRGKAPECAWHRCFFRIKYFGLSALTVHPDLRHRVAPCAFT